MPNKISQQSVREAALPLSVGNGSLLRKMGSKSSACSRCSRAEWREAGGAGSMGRQGGDSGKSRSWKGHEMLSSTNPKL